MPPARAVYQAIHPRVEIGVGDCVVKSGSVRYAGGAPEPSCEHCR